MVKRGLMVTEDKREKVRLLLLMNNAHPERYPQLFVSFDDVVGELIRVYEEVKGDIRDPGLLKCRPGQSSRARIVGAEGIP